MNIKRMSARLAVAGIALASTAVLVNGGTAGAAQVGDLTVTPSTGTTTDITLEFDTSGACPAPASNVIVSLEGGAISSPIILVGNGPLSAWGANGNGGKHIVAGRTIKAALQDDGVDLATGSYQLVATCQNVSGSNVTGDFRAKFAYTRTAAFEGSFSTSATTISTTTTLAAVSPSTYGDSVTFDATVAQGRGATVPTGTVQFKDGTTNLGAPQTVTSGAASYTTSALGAGSHSVTAVFTPADTNAFDGSTSSARSLAVSKKATGVTVTTNGPTQENTNASFTATVTGGAAGSVQFKVNGANNGSPVVVSGGTATRSTSTLPAGTYTVSAVFTPSDAANYDGSTATDVSHQVTAFSGASATQPITVNVPTGSLVISIDDEDAATPVPVVDLGVATFEADGQWWHAAGQLNNVIITDTRAGDPGWSATGIVSDFTNGVAGAVNPTTVSGYNLGWAPSLVSKAANQVGLHVGAAVASAKVATGDSYSGTAGLGAPRELATTTNDNGNGTAILKGAVDLYLPTDVQAGDYTATLTFTVI